MDNILVGTILIRINEKGEYNIDNQFQLGLVTDNQLVNNKYRI